MEPDVHVQNDSATASFCMRRSNITSNTHIQRHENPQVSRQKKSKQSTYHHPPHPLTCYTDPLLRRCVWCKKSPSHLLFYILPVVTLRKTSIHRTRSAHLSGQTGPNYLIRLSRISSTYREILGYYFKVFLLKFSLASFLINYWKL